VNGRSAVAVVGVVALVAAVAPARATRRPTLVVPILMYHRIDVLDQSLPPMTRRLTVAPADFARQMRWLRRNGYHTLTQRELLDALMRGRDPGPKPIVITFDDGYRDVLTYASPGLAQLGMHAISYVITSRISNGDPSFLTWSQLRALEQRGIEIGSHTVRHRDLTTLPDAELRAELVRSRLALERVLGHGVPWLAYPYGACDARVTRFARRAGYVLAVTTRPGTVQAAAAPLELRRLSVTDSTRVSGLAAMLGR